MGACFWQHAARERGPRRWLLDASGRCRCVLVDTEPKAVHAAVQAVGPQRLHARCALVERGGRGNSWAMGYHGIAPPRGRPPVPSPASPPPPSRPSAGSGSGATASAAS